MNRSAIWSALAVVIVVFSMSLPAWAQGSKGSKVVFEANLVPGLYWPQLTETEGGFVKGSVKVFADGTAEIKIVGAQPNETYDVLMGYLLYLYPAGGGKPIMGDVAWPPMPTAAVGDQTLKLRTDAKGIGTATSWFPNFDYPCIGFALDDEDNEEQNSNTDPLRPIGPNRYVTGVRFYY